jgi:hypothetical protein
MSHSRIHDPKYIGPGIWFSLHTLGAMSKTKEQKRFAVEYIRYLQQNFPCGDCKGHFGNYIQTHPLETIINDNNEESLFLWIFNFHNAVNHRLKKPQASYEDIKNIYYTNSEFCMSDCSSDNKNKHPNIIPRDMPGDIF